MDWELCQRNSGHRFEWYALRDNGFELQSLPEDGVFRSETFPGLWLNASAMLNRDGNTMMKSLNDGLSQPEHKAFVARLALRRHR